MHYPVVEAANLFIVSHGACSNSLFLVMKELQNNPSHSSQF